MGCITSGPERLPSARARLSVDKHLTGALDLGGQIESRLVSAQGTACQLSFTCTPSGRLAGGQRVGTHRIESSSDHEQQSDDAVTISFPKRVAGPANISNEWVGLLGLQVIENDASVARQQSAACWQRHDLVLPCTVLESVAMCARPP